MALGNVDYWRTFRDFETNASIIADQAQDIVTFKGGDNIRLSFNEGDDIITWEADLPGIIADVTANITVNNDIATNPSMLEYDPASGEFTYHPPDLSDYATLNYVNSAVAGGISNIDLSSYATEDWVMGYVGSAVPDLNDYATIVYVDQSINDLGANINEQIDRIEAGPEGPQGTPGSSVKIVGSVENYLELLTRAKWTSYLGDVGDGVIMRQGTANVTYGGETFDIEPGSLAVVVDLGPPTIWDPTPGRIIGYSGSQGYTGSQGIQGDAGFTGSAVVVGQFLYEQNVASNVWTVTHNLGQKYLSVELINDQDDSLVGTYSYPVVRFLDENNLTVTWTEPTTGKAVLSAGSGSQGTVGFVGSQGIAGFTGSIGYSGSAGPPLRVVGSVPTFGDLPDPYFGDVNDVYVIEDTGRTAINVQLVPGVWDDLGPWIGYTGSVGLTVTDATVAANGNLIISRSDGVEFDAGYTVGFTGSIGYTGSKGDTGFGGSTGFDGSTGVTGFTGSKGDQGDTGFTGSAVVVGHQIYEQTTPSSVWTVNHNMGVQYLSVEIVNDNNDTIVGTYSYPTVKFIDSNNLTVTWPQPRTGRIVMSAGGGEQGDTGFDGSRGDQGFGGSKGDTGFTGSTGAFAAIGFTGSQGATGFVGSRGEQGDDGFTGSQGDQGLIGFTGSEGDQGIIGYTGSRGIVGFTGSQGNQGIIGFTGSQGDQGDIGFTGSKGDIGFTGSKGETGASGTSVTIVGQVANFASLPGTYTGNLGDGYILDDTGNLAVVTDLGPPTVWEDVGQIVGYTGSQGDQGLIGFTGSRGDVGFTGSKGDQGIIGFTGSQGAIGFTGSQGDQGIIGFTGSQGFDGSTGFNGSKGDQGNVGFTGSKGDTGFNGSIGDQGNVGFTGSKGDTGFNGSIGDQGGVGFNGSKGDQGDVGFTGSKGDQGDTGFTGSASTAQGPIGFTGSRGIPGEAASQGFTGSRGDTGFTGSKGDIGFTGSQGDQGNVGFTGSASTAQGPIGFSGSKGDQGDAGFTGSASTVIGFTGSKGETGDRGFNGSQGTKGFTGSLSTTPGPIGFTGSRGDDGIAGFTGSRGFGGSRGDTGFTGSDGADTATLSSVTNNGSFTNNDISIGGMAMSKDINFSTSVPASGALDLNKTVHSLANGNYTLADGFEGQLLIITPRTGATRGGVNLTFSKIRSFNTTNSVAEPATVFTNVTLGIFVSSDLTIGSCWVYIFADGAWNYMNLYQ